MESIKFIIPHFSPYRDDVVSELSNNESGINVDVYMYGLYTEHLEWNLSNKLKVDKVGVFELFRIFLSAKKKSTVFFIPGWRFFWLFLSLIARVKGNRVVCCTDTKEASFISIRRRVYNYLFYGFFLSGEASYQYLSKNFTNKIFTKGIYCLNRDSVNLMHSNRSNFNKKSGAPSNNFKLVSVANFLPSRNQETFLREMDAILQRDDKVTIVFIGKGYPNSFVKMTKELRFVNVVFQRPIEFNRIPEILKGYDAVVHPGNEPYSTFLVIAALLNCVIFSDSTVGAYSCLANSNYKNIFSMTDLHEIIKKKIGMARDLELYTPPRYLIDPQYVAKSLIENYLRN